MGTIVFRDVHIICIICIYAYLVSWLRERFNSAGNATNTRTLMVTCCRCSFLFARLRSLFVCDVLRAAGPDGCNLFVFHIPNTMTNEALFRLFSKFGNVISARIMVEKATGRSRGFGED